MEGLRDDLLRKVLADPPTLLSYRAHFPHRFSYERLTTEELEEWESWVLSEAQKLIALLNDGQVIERLKNYPNPPTREDLIPTLGPVTDEPITAEDEARWRIAARRPKRSYIEAPLPLTAAQRAELEADVAEVLGEVSGPLQAR
jgi:hypothetical protein